MDLKYELGLLASKTVEELSQMRLIEIVELLSEIGKELNRAGLENHAFRTYFFSQHCMRNPQHHVSSQDNHLICHTCDLDFTKEDPNALFTRTMLSMSR